SSSHGGDPVKHSILCGVLVLATGDGVAYLVANRSAPVPTPASPVETSPTTAETASTDPSAPCPKCQAGSSTVTDVIDLSAKFATKSEAQGEFISFDEPPLAKPKAGVTPVQHETPELPDLREVLPPPREVK